MKIHEITENSNIKIKKNGLYINGTLEFAFKSITDCKNSYYNIYAYVDNSDTEELNIKVGWAKNGVYNRYQHQDSKNPYERVIGLWHVDSDTVADSFVHAPESSHLFQEEPGRYADKLYTLLQFRSLTHQHAYLYRKDGNCAKDKQLFHSARCHNQYGRHLYLPVRLRPVPGKSLWSECSAFFHAFGCLNHHPFVPGCSGRPRCRARVSECGSECTERTD